MTICELNNKYYSLFETLYNASSKLPEKQFVIMSNVLMKQYEQEVEDYLDEQELNFAMQRFALKFKVQAYTPRRVFLWRWNKTARQLLKQYKAELQTFLAELGKDIREEKQYAERLNDEASQTPNGSATTPTVLTQSVSSAQATALMAPSETDIAPKE